MSPDARKHRGTHPEDRRLFANDRLASLRTAVSDLSWLLTHEYRMKGALKLVGDRYSLTERQRLAVSRASCSDQSREQRMATSLVPGDIEGADVILDGFNIVITVEAALSGGLLIDCRDRCIRDLSSVHGSYRSVSETEQAISRIGEALRTLKAASVVWVLDRPISNSGRLAKRIRQQAVYLDENWTVEVVFNPDAEILRSNRIVITTDSHVLDHAKGWFNLNGYLIQKDLAESWLIELS